MEGDDAKALKGIGVIFPGVGVQGLRVMMLRLTKHRGHFLRFRGLR